MEKDQTHVKQEPWRAEPLSGGDLAQASGGVGYSSIRCKRCGKLFNDLEQYGKHIEAGCERKPKR